jgi:hypothetical protein
MMLPDRLSGYLTALARLAEQPANRWDGFDLSAPDSPSAGLRDQIGFAGLALGVIARHPAASPAECERARGGVAALARRLAQRRVWAAWGTAAERLGHLPDPVREGNAGYSGLLAALLCLAELLGGDPSLAEPLALHWSSDFHFSYDAQAAAEVLWRQARAHPDGAVASVADTAHPHEMAHVLWALRLHGLALGGDLAAAGEPWLRALSERLAMRGPRLPRRGALAGSYNLRRRAASLGGDRLTDAWTLALIAPLAPELTERLIPRHWAQSRTVAERGSALELAFDYLLAVELRKELLAAQLLAAADERFAPVADAGGRRYDGAPAAPWVTALIAIGEAGGLGLLLRQQAGGAAREAGEQAIGAAALGESPPEEEA